MRCPGSGLDASDLTLASPSGNMIVFSTRAFGWPTTNGPSTRDDHAERGEREAR